MWPTSWQDALQQSLTQMQQHKKRPLRIAILGIGHELRGDDGAGLAVARRLRPLAHEYLLVIEAGQAPENHTGTLRRFTPDLVLLIDAAQLDEAPGTIRWLPWSATSGLSASTHTMPPYMLARFLTAELGCEVALIGIQPGHISLQSSLSPLVIKCVNHITDELRAALFAPNSP